jgi:hypothetical protein
MAANVKNIIVGAAQIFMSTGSGSSRPTTVPGAGNLNWSTQKAAGYLNANSSTWRDLGYTTSGLEVSYEPGYGEVMVDQLLDAARLFKQTIKVLLKSELTEATLENLHVVFGQADNYITYSGSVGTSNSTLTVATSSAANAANGKLNISAGALGDAPVERSLVAVGQAPGNLGSVNAPVDASSMSGASLPGKERIYVARRVVQVEVTSHALKRDTATVFPVQFRCLPDDADAYDGAEYGVIVDRVYSTL